MSGATMPPASRATLTWSVKESFLAYVNRTRGRITLVEPAYPGAAGFAFPHAPAAGHTESGGAAPDGSERAFPVGELTFTGGVAFLAHGGLLDITLAEPVLVFGARGALLTIADMTRRGGGTRLVIAELTGGPHMLADNTLLHQPMLDVFDEVFSGSYRYPMPEIPKK